MKIVGVWKDLKLVIYLFVSVALICFVLYLKRIVLSKDLLMVLCLVLFLLYCWGWGLGVGGVGWLGCCFFGGRGFCFYVLLFCFNLFSFFFCGGGEGGGRLLVFICWFVVGFVVTI